MRAATQHITPRTPPSIIADIRDFTATFIDAASPSFAYATCQPRRESAVSECFNAVEAHVTEHGGKALYGWAIWEHPGVLLEAEFHAVWCSPIGGLVDVVNRGDDTRAQILFVQDPSRRPEGRQVDTIRWPLVDDPRMPQMLQASTEIYEIMNRGDRAWQRKIYPSLEERSRLKELHAMKALLIGELVRDHGTGGR